MTLTKWVNRRYKRQDIELFLPADAELIVTVDHCRKCNNNKIKGVLCVILMSFLEQIYICHF